MAKQPVGPSVPATKTATNVAPVLATPTAPVEGKKKRTKKEKKEKIEKIEYRFDPKLFPAEKFPDGNGPLIEGSVPPADYNPKQHKGLRRTDFQKASDFYSYRADICEQQAKDFRVKAAQEGTENKKTKRFIALQNQMANLLSELQSDSGFDLTKVANNDLLKALLEKTEKPATK
jgi:hypothetical protein